MMPHVERIGHGPDIVLLHGWGLNGAVWGPFIEALAPHFQLHVVDLPGHGFNAQQTLPTNLDAVGALIFASVPTRAVWLGWSLGGLIALAAARYKPDAVTRLILIGSTPRFVANDDWAHGVPLPVLQQFAADLRNDFAATLRQFLALQALGMPNARAMTRDLAALMLARPAPTEQALTAGLTLLRESALEREVAQLKQALLVIHGAQDRLVPISAGDYLARTAPHGELLRIERAGHVPFLSHTRDIADRIVEFAHGA